MAMEDEEDQVAELPPGTLILQSCERHGVPFNCKQGQCGTCVIKVQEGMEHLSPPTDAERALLGRELSEKRLACQCTLQSGRVRYKSNQPVLY